MTGVLLGYARVSTQRQSLDMQLDALYSAGVNSDRVWQEKKSSRDYRPELDALLNYAREGDTIVVWRLDRFGRTTLEVLQTIHDINARGIDIVGIVDGADSRTTTGRMMITILCAIAEYERELISERAAAARQARADRGLPVGRRRALNSDQREQARRLRDQDWSVPMIMREFGVSRATVYRALSS